MLLLARLHLAYLALVPFAGLFWLQQQSYRGVVALTGWLAVVIYLTVLLATYRLTRAPLRAAAVILLAPLQVGLSAALWGGGPLAFCYEEACVEVAALSGALALAMLRYLPSGPAGAIVGVMICGSFTPFVLPLLQAAREWPLPSQVLLASGLLSALWSHYALIAPAAGAASETGEAQSLEVVHGEEGLAGLLPGGEIEGVVAPGVDDDFTTLAILLSLVLWVVTIVAARLLPGAQG